MKWKPEYLNYQQLCKNTWDKQRNRTIGLLFFWLVDLDLNSKKRDANHGRQFDVTYQETTKLKNKVILCGMAKR